MNTQLMPSKDVGLQHVLENGLALIKDEPLGDDRRRQVLDNLIKIFSEADKGSAALGAHNLLFAAEQRPAFERFNLFFRYLKDIFGADLPSRLAEAATVLTELRDGRAHDKGRRARTAELIESLLVALQRESALSPLSPPRVLKYR